jgi:glycosyltransferase involved in cell wall biosynthesis
VRQNSSVLSSDFFITHQVRVLVNQGHGTTNKVLVNQGHDTTKIALITNFELRPPWSDGIRVFTRGLVDSIARAGDAHVTISNLDSITENCDYDYAHIVTVDKYRSAPRLLLNVNKRLKHTTIFKHIVTPANKFSTAINTYLFYKTVDALWGSKLVKCFSSVYTAHSYYMQDRFIIPPPIDTEHFSVRQADWDKLFSILGASDTTRWVNNIKKSDGGLLLYSGPLSEDRFSYKYVLNAVKHAKCQILIVGRFWRELNNGAISYVNDMVNYARKIGIENKVSIVSRMLSEDEKITLMNCADAIVQPFDNKLKKIAVDPPIFMLESMACGKPVITSKVYSFKSVIRNGYNGFTVDWDDPEEINEAFSDCISCSQIGYNARNTILQNFSIDAVAKKLRGMYDAFS